MTERKSGKSKKQHKEKAEKINLREAALALNEAEKKKVSLSSAAKTSEDEIGDVTYAKEPMPESKLDPKPSRALVTTPKPNGEDVAETLQQSLTAAQKGATAVNAKLFDIAQETMNSGLEHARDLAGAKNPMQMLKLQMSYWHDIIESFNAQAQELHALSSELVAKSSEPIQAHLRRAHAAKR